MVARAFKNVGQIKLVWITLLCYRDLLAHLEEVQAGSGVSDRVGHHGEQLVSSSHFMVPICISNRRAGTCCISSWSCIVWSIPTAGKVSS